MQNAREIYIGIISKLPESEKIELASMILQSLASKRTPDRISVADLLSGLPKRTSRSVKVIDESIRKERDAWDN